MCLNIVYFAEIEKLLLKEPSIKIKISWNSKIEPMNSVKKYSKTHKL